MRSSGTQSVCGGVIQTPRTVLTRSFQPVSPCNAWDEDDGIRFIALHPAGPLVPGAVVEVEHAIPSEIQHPTYGVLGASGEPRASFDRAPRLCEAQKSADSI